MGKHLFKHAAIEKSYIVLEEIFRLYYTFSYTPVKLEKSLSPWKAKIIFDIRQLSSESLPLHSTACLLLP